MVSCEYYQLNCLICLFNEEYDVVTSIFFLPVCLKSAHINETSHDFTRWMPYGLLLFAPESQTTIHEQRFSSMANVLIVTLFGHILVTWAYWRFALGLRPINLCSLQTFPFMVSWFVAISNDSTNSTLSLWSNWFYYIRVLIAYFYCHYITRWLISWKLYMELLISA